ncbi:hypothetical protein CBR_g48877 [Chara braunii]|uniref:Uncharacterized protein n=1 Tax=Chara braunii TaxID=69332 RepID=A0A388M3Y3_CHABU|nr:hypothetical protein CBR_g48877 [Chara braunii]|eukprot:GBG89169.1 hypothetical protein CBR_g48877 [Chara braunii]
MEIGPEMARVHVTYLRAHIVIIRFGGTLNEFSAGMKTDLIRRWEDTWPNMARGRFQGRITVDNNGTATYWAPTALLRNWMIDRRTKEEVVIDGKTCKARFSAWETPVEKEWNHMMEKKNHPWVKFINPSALTRPYLHVAANQVFGEVINDDGEQNIDEHGKEEICFQLRPPLRQIGLQRLAIRLHCYGRPEVRYPTSETPWCTLCRRPGHLAGHTRCLSAHETERELSRSLGDVAGASNARFLSRMQIHEGASKDASPRISEHASRHSSPTRRRQHDGAATAAHHQQQDDRSRTGVRRDEPPPPENGQVTGRGGRQEVRQEEKERMEITRGEIQEVPIQGGEGDDGSMNMQQERMEQAQGGEGGDGDDEMDTSSSPLEQDQPLMRRTYGRKEVIPPLDHIMEDHQTSTKMATTGEQQRNREQQTDIVLGSSQMEVEEPARLETSQEEGPPRQRDTNREEMAMEDP